MFGHRRDDGDDLVALDLLQEGADERVLHGLVDEVDVHEAGRIGDDRVAAVEDADLHQLVGGDVLDELDADLLEGGAARGEVVLDHPLQEVLAEDRPGVLDAEFLAGDPPLAVGGRGRDAVDHGIGEGDVGAHPRGEAGVLGGGEAGDGVAADRPLCGMLSQDITVKGAMPAARRAFRPARIRPKTVFGSSGLRASATMAGFSGSNLPVAGFTK